MRLRRTGGGWICRTGGRSHNNRIRDEEILAKAESLATQGPHDEGNGTGVAGPACLVAGVGWVASLPGRAIIVRCAQLCAGGTGIDGSRILNNRARPQTNARRALRRRSVVHGLERRVGAPQVAGGSEVAQPCRRGRCRASRVACITSGIRRIRAVRIDGANEVIGPRTRRCENQENCQKDVSSNWHDDDLQCFQCPAVFNGFIFPRSRRGRTVERFTLPHAHA